MKANSMENTSKADQAIDVGDVTSSSALNHEEAHKEAVRKALTEDHFVMKMVVIFLGVILLVLAITFFVLLALKGDKEKESAITPVREAIELTQSHILVLETGEEIAHMAISDDILAVHVTGPNGQRIILVNPYTADHKGVITVTNRAP